MGYRKDGFLFFTDECILAEWEGFSRGRENSPPDCFPFLFESHPHQYLCQIQKPAHWAGFCIWRSGRDSPAVGETVHRTVSPSCSNPTHTNTYARNKNQPIGLVLVSGGVGGIRTLGTLLTYTRFPVVLVMTASIPLRMNLSAAAVPCPALALAWSCAQSLVSIYQKCPFVNSFFQFFSGKSGFVELMPADRASDKPPLQRGGGPPARAVEGSRWVLPSLVGSAQSPIPHPSAPVCALGHLPLPGEVLRELTKSESAEALERRGPEPGPRRVPYYSFGSSR